MTTVPILSGAYVDGNANLRAALPRNMEPRLIDSGISKGELRTFPGLGTLITNLQPDRGAINWSAAVYRVRGDQLVRVNGNVVEGLGVVAGSEPVAMDYSFDRLGIVGDGKLYYYDGASVTQVTDPSVGYVSDMVWIDSYFVLTDGAYIYVTDLSDPTVINPLKYGSAEVDPDPIVALRKVRGELYALGRYTIQNYQDVGGTGFPFQNNPGGLIAKGVVGFRARCDYLESFAFVGGGRGEGVGVYLAGQGDASKLSSAEIDTQLADLTDQQLANIVLESIVSDGEQRLLVHLETMTLVYYRQASIANGSPVWTELASGEGANQTYAGRFFVRGDGRWLAADADAIVVWSDAVEPQRDATTGWSFSTVFLYAKGSSGILKEVELIGVVQPRETERAPQVTLSWSYDGKTWSRPLSSSILGQRLVWRPRVKFGKTMILKFSSASSAVASFASLEVDVEGLS